MSGIALEAATLEVREAGSGWMQAQYLAHIAGSWVGDGKTTYSFVPNKDSERLVGESAKALVVLLDAEDRWRREQELVEADPNS